MQGLDALFHARSVALIGISADALKMTGAPLGILRQTGFTGTVYPVNPRYTEIQGVPCWPDVQALPQAPDVAMIMLGAARVPETVRACAAKGVGAVVVLSSGFEETEEGHAHAQALARVARETGIAVVGPNCEGVWSVPDRVLLTFGSAAKREVLHNAPIAILSQSGAMAGALGRHLQDSGVGCAYLVSVGNETVLTIADYFEWMIGRDDVKVVLLFIEGLRDGQRLLRLIERATARGIRVVALKSGNSVKGLEAAASHTGKMASPYAVYRDLLHEAGAIQVDSLTQLLEAAEVLSVLPLPPPGGGDGGDGGVSVFSIPGGTRAMTADALEQEGVPLATFARGTVAALADALPEFGGTENPTDLTGQVLSHPGLFDRCLNLIADDPNTQALIVQVANRGPRDVIERIDLLRAVAARTGVPTVVSFLGDALPADQRARLRAVGVVCARDPVEASRFLGWVWRARAAQAHEAAPEVAPASSIRPVTTLPGTLAQTFELLRDCGLAVPRWRVVPADADAAAACEGLNFPVAVKALPEDADHKTELGLVRLGVHAGELAAAVQDIRQRLARPGAGVLVQEMDAGGVEVLLSALRNADFGPVLAIGMGGTATELHGDVAYVSLPTTPARLTRAIARLKLATLLAGFRGKPAADTDALLAAACALGDRFVALQPAVSELEINPLFVHARGSGRVVAVDALLSRRPDRAPGSPVTPAKAGDSRG
jgi:acyl-CoA synthetase (NDP forming)